jgi:hypothetical protein
MVGQAVGHVQEQAKDNASYSHGGQNGGAMNLQNVLYPEIILNKRGDAKQREFLHLFLNNIRQTDEGVYCQFPPGLAHVATDPNYSSHFSLCKRFIDTEAPTYHICKDFAEALMSIPDREIPVDFLSDFFGYISFPQDTVTDGADWVEGALVYIGVADRTTAMAPHLYGKRMLWMTYVCKQTETSNPIMPSIGKLIVELKKDTVGNLAASVPQEDRMHHGNVIEELEDTDRTARSQITRLCLNTVLYLSSQEPVVHSLHPTFGKSISQRKKHKVGDFINSCTVPVIAVNWEYKKSRNYTTDQTFVVSHPRWQRCGPNLSQIKLVWVKEHVRTFKGSSPLEQYETP